MGTPSYTPSKNQRFLDGGPDFMPHRNDCVLLTASEESEQTLGNGAKQSGFRTVLLRPRESALHKRKADKKAGRLAAVGLSSCRNSVTYDAFPRRRTALSVCRLWAAVCACSPPQARRSSRARYPPPQQAGRRARAQQARALSSRWARLRRARGRAHGAA